MVHYGQSWLHTHPPGTQGRQAGAREWQYPCTGPCTAPALSTRRTCTCPGHAAVAPKTGPSPWAAPSPHADPSHLLRHNFAVIIQFVLANTGKSCHGFPWQDLGTEPQHPPSAQSCEQKAHQPMAPTNGFRLHAGKSLIFFRRCRTDMKRCLGFSSTSSSASSH